MRPIIASLILVSTLLIPRHAQAQSTTLPRIPADQTVWITSTDGFELQGRIIGTSADAIDVAATSGGVRRLALRDIHIIEKKDSNANGFWTGFAVGVAPTVMLGRGQAFTTSTGLMFITIGGLSYGGIGWLIDNAIEGREVIYRIDTDHVAVNVAPIVGFGREKRVGFGGAITWR